MDNIMNNINTEEVIEAAQAGVEKFIEFDPRIFAAGFGTGVGATGIGYAVVKHGIPKVREWWQGRKDKKTIDEAVKNGKVEEVEGDIVDEK